MRSVAQLEVTEEDPAQHAEDGRPSGKHGDLKHPTAFMNSQDFFPQVSQEYFGGGFPKLFRDEKVLKVC